MIGQLNGLPAGVIRFEASGKIAAEDYRDIVLPALEQAASAGGRGVSNLLVEVRSMISALTGLPDGVIGFEASGKIAAEDYRDVVVPALEQAAEAGDVRFVIVMRDFDGISGGALWQDLKMGIEHLRSWKRIALVTDITWMTHATDLFGWMTPGETKTFHLDEKDHAIRWAAG